MATNLRLSPEVAAALQAEAERTGKSQQEIIRDAVARHLHLIGHEAPLSDREQARVAGLVRPARVPYRRAAPRLRLPEGMTSLELLDREDRL
ncbi:ribbon-helix-helix protein, CopG family [Kribbella sp. NPDC051952]|uniref:ribbon-helix-helix protein, CopG family n=1 Tax=Kribbella sp. NPDC051952 TaxID=3154851 RepID=UPI003435DBD6